jgi:hypothetical protein
MRMLNCCAVALTPACAARVQNSLQHDRASLCSRTPREATGGHRSQPGPRGRYQSAPRARQPRVADSGGSLGRHWRRCRRRIRRTLRRAWYYRAVSTLPSAAHRRGRGAWPAFAAENSSRGTQRVRRAQRDPHECGPAQRQRRSHALLDLPLIATAMLSLEVCAHVRPRARGPNNGTEIDVAHHLLFDGSVRPVARPSLGVPLSLDHRIVAVPHEILCYNRDLM